jgi:hypothetical protein
VHFLVLGFGFLLLGSLAKAQEEDAENGIPEDVPRAEVEDEEARALALDEATAMSEATDAEANQEAAVTESGEAEVDQEAAVTESGEAEVDQEAAVTESGEAEVDQEAAVTESGEAEVDQEAAVTESGEAEVDQDRGITDPVSVDAGLTPETDQESLTTSIDGDDDTDSSVPDGGLKIEARNYRPGKAQVGTWRIRVLGARPKEFNDDLKHYDKLYDGKKPWYPMLAVDWFVIDWYATLGLSFKSGLYSVNGHTANNIEKPIEQITDDEVVKNENGPTTLTMIPTSIALTGQLAPFDGRFFSIDVWIGYEHLIFQEARRVKASSAILLAAEADGTLVNSGTHNSLIFGASMNFLLNSMDEQSVSSLTPIFGIGYIYLSPFVELAKSTQSTGVKLGRSTYGIGFTFESNR